MPVEDLSIMLRLRGFREGIAQMFQAAKASKLMGDEIQKSGQKMERAGHHGFLFNQVLFTMRRYLYNATLGATALAAAGSLIGLKFNATIERTTIALQALGKGQFNASEQTREFLRIARETAFLPQQILDIGQSYIAFGFTAEETNRTLRALGFTIASLNLPQATIDRIVFALGQIRVKGRVMGEELRQLANANIPAYRYLAEAFGENVTQLNRIGDARIPATAGIEAILKGLERDYSETGKAVMRTTSAQVEILKGDLQAILGALWLTPFELLGERLRRITAVTGKMFEVVLAGGGAMDMVKILDDATGAGGRLIFTVRRIGKLFESLAGSVGMAWDVFRPFLKALFLASLGFVILTTAVLDFIQLGGSPLVLILQALVAWWIAETAVKKISLLWTKRRIFWEKVETFWINRKIVALKLGRLAYLLYIGATRAATIATIIFSTALKAHPLVLIAFAILSFIIYLVELERRTGKVSEAIQKMWDKMRAFFEWFSWVRKPKNFVEDLFGEDFFAWGRRGPPRRFRFGMAGGGLVSGAGNFLVGERGPEVVSLPVGTSVTPVSADRASWDGMGRNINVTVMPAPVYIDGREVAEVVFKHSLDRQARR
jgi:tape measure domain-containing protein